MATRYFQKLCKYAHDLEPDVVVELVYKHKTSASATTLFLDSTKKCIIIFTRKNRACKSVLGTFQDMGSLFASLDDAVDYTNVTVSFHVGIDPVFCKVAMNLT